MKQSKRCCGIDRFLFKLYNYFNEIDNYCYENKYQYGVIYLKFSYLLLLKTFFGHLHLLECQKLTICNYNKEYHEVVYRESVLKMRNSGLMSVFV